MKYLFIFLIASQVTLAQYNCNSFLTKEKDSCMYKACKYIENAMLPFQLTKAYHDIYNEALDICPDYHPAYRNKSTAYLKTGDFVKWMELMDRAVELAPEEHLSYRGWCRLQFFRDYKGAIADIERLDSISKYDIGYSQNGTYHLNVAKALCYKMLGQKNKAIKIIEDHFESGVTSRDLYDYYHLGVLYYEKKEYEKALLQFKNQLNEYDFAGNKYYMSLTYSALKNAKTAKETMQNALELYNNNMVMYDPYTHQVDKVYKSQISNQLQLYK